MFNHIELEKLVICVCRCCVCSRCKLNHQKSAKTKLSEPCAVILDLFPACVKGILLKKVKASLALLDITKVYWWQNVLSFILLRIFGMFWKSRLLFDFLNIGRIFNAVHKVECLDAIDLVSSVHAAWFSITDMYFKTSWFQTGVPAYVDFLWRLSKCTDKCTQCNWENCIMYNNAA